ncbi:MAG TPA: CADD family putative folate metabolism protein [Pyrinomonadaceae bacterium]|jgi:pyrroloquinoline-quinone synthase
MTNATQQPVRSDFETKLRLTVMQHSMLKHPFYVAWNEGKLSKAVLAEYAKQYYAHVRAFPTYVSGVHSHCEDLEVRRELLENLIEEERGNENHPELWLRFAEALGVERDAVRSAELLPSTIASVNSLQSLTQSADYRKGLAALFAYESQIPAVAQTKREGLKEFYGIDDERAVSFFRVHEDIDVLHNEVEARLLTEACAEPAQQEEAVASAKEAAKALWMFLDGVSAAYFPTAAVPANA